MHDDGANTELRRLREDLYRPSPPAGAVERYTALLERQHVEHPEPVTPSRSEAAPRRRRLLPAAVLAAAVLVAGVAAVVIVPDRHRDPSQAEVFVTGGPYAVADRDAIDSLLDPGGSDVRLIARAVAGSELDQLDVWDTREPAVWLQQGVGPVTRRFDGRPPAEDPRPFSIVLQCDRPTGYRWTILGTTPERPAVHVLETASTTSCGEVPTVATFTRPEGAVVRGFDLAIADDARWGMVFVRPADQGY